MVAAPRRTKAQNAGARIRRQTRTEHRHTLTDDFAKGPGVISMGRGTVTSPSIRGSLLELPKWR